MTTIDQTNAEVSDERLREIKPCPFCGGEPLLISGGPGNHFVQCTDCNASSDDREQAVAIALWNRRSVTSQASEGEGWVYFNEDSGEEYSPSHPVESGECEDATDIRRSTPQEDHLWAALQEEFQRAEALAVAPVSKRVERLETGIQKAIHDLVAWKPDPQFPSQARLRESIIQHLEALGGRS